jgi:hypothetical protein
MRPDFIAKAKVINDNEKMRLPTATLTSRVLQHCLRRYRLNLAVQGELSGFLSVCTCLYMKQCWLSIFNFPFFKGKQLLHSN